MVYIVHLSTQFICKIHSPNVQFFDYPIVHLISIIFTVTTLVFAHIVPSAQKFFYSWLNLAIYYMSFKPQMTCPSLRKDFNDLSVNINSSSCILQSNNTHCNVIEICFIIYLKSISNTK